MTPGLHRRRRRGSLTRGRNPRRAVSVLEEPKATPFDDASCQPKSACSSKLAADTGSAHVGMGRALLVEARLVVVPMMRLRLSLWPDQFGTKGLMSVR